VPFTVKIASSALEDLQSIRVFDRRRITDTIQEQLTHEPTVKTRHRKILVEIHASFPHSLPLWELRVGDFRVLYNVEEDAVVIRAIRAKPPHQTTDQVL
jgi:mRNA-degrading endonuclease RelE of RelBE toxin-antitoxin system